MIDELVGADGALCEVRTPQNDLIFFGEIEQSSGDEITVAEASGKLLPQVIYNTEVKLTVRGLRRASGVPLVIFGQICGSTKWIWKIDRLKRFQFSELRESFRQRVGVAGKALCMNRVFRQSGGRRAEYYPSLPCRILDVSVTGVLFSGREEYEVGDYVLLHQVSFLPVETPYVFTCRVCRLTQVGDKEIGYGCCFVGLPDREKDRLCQTIFALQRAEIQNCRK